MENKDVKKSQVMELKDLISGPLIATIEADSISSRHYLNYLFELAFESYDKQTGKTGKLRTLTFTYMSNDVNGSRKQRVSIPLLTLVPLPLLQVKEAEFDFDIQILHAMSQDTFSLKDGTTNLSQGVKLQVSLAPSSTKDSSESHVKQSIAANMRVKVKMQQADMPGGLSNLLHLTTNNVMIEEEADVKEEDN